MAFILKLTNMKHCVFGTFLSRLFPFLSLSPLQSTMNLPPDKLTLLSQYDNEKKWELVCDQVR